MNESKIITMVEELNSTLNNFEVGYLENGILYTDLNDVEEKYIVRKPYDFYRDEVGTQIDYILFQYERLHTVFNCRNLLIDINAPWPYQFFFTVFFLNGKYIYIESYDRKLIGVHKFDSIYGITKLILSKINPKNIEYSIFEINMSIDYTGMSEYDVTTTMCDTGTDITEHIKNYIF